MQYGGPILSRKETNLVKLPDISGGAERSSNMNMPTPPSLLDDLDEHHDGQQADPPAQEVDFSEYVWMGEELEEFDRQVWGH